MFPIGTRYQAPNVQNIAIQTVAEILKHPEGMFKLGVTLAAGFPTVHVGDVLGQITATGKYRRYTNSLVKVGVTSATISLTDNTGNVIFPPYVPGDIIDIGSNASNTVLTVDAANGRVTVGSSITVSTSDAVHLHTADGSGTADCIAARPIFGPGYNPSLPSINNLLDVDYLLDCYFQGILRKSGINGLDSAAITALSAQFINTQDCVIIR